LTQIVAGYGKQAQTWIATASPRHWLLIRRHLATGECAYHYCHILAGQPVSFTRLITAARPALTGRGEP
jgi:hypothetical protein